jgi:hypothetical protein
MTLIALIRGFLCVCMGSLLISCAAIPQQTYLNNRTLAGINNVGIVVIASTPKVFYSVDAPNAGEAGKWASVGTGIGIGLSAPAALGIPALGPLLAIPIGIENAVRTGIDKEHAARIAECTDSTFIENKTAQSFIQHLKKGAFFQRIEYMPNKNQDSSQLTSLGYDAVIRLTVREITVQRAPGDYIRLTAKVYGEMERLNSGRIVWDREEFVTNPEPHTLDYYKENGLRELDAMLEKASRNLAYDFLYLK